jgi:formate hydrogenlyase transcriptional activator
MDIRKDKNRTEEESKIVKAHILVVDDTPENLHLLMGILTAQGYDVRLAPDGPLALKFARTTPPDLILLDIKMPGMDGYAVCEQLKTGESTRDIPVIFLSALDNVEDKVKSFDVGGIDYIPKPFQSEEVLVRVKTHLLLHRLRNHLEELVAERTAELRMAVAEAKQLNEQLQGEIIERQRIEQELRNSLEEIQQLKNQLQSENIYLREEIKIEHNFDEIIGQSKSLEHLLGRVEQVAATDTTVLITGETGTGKELIARAIHHASLRKDRPLVKVNCAALPAHLIESELFGHEKGAFTGAMARRIGRFELADGATVFLDEIGELPLELQPKLLRVLQDGEFERLGSSQTLKVDVRMMAATNRNLNAEVRAGRFRQDLYYRLNVYPLTVPPLRERPEDIPLLVQFLVQKFNKKLGKQVETIPQQAMFALQQYAWPGNIRELENVIERAMLTTPDTVLRVELPENLMTTPEAAQTLEAHEREYIIHILQSTHGRIHGPKGAAVILGINPWTLRSRMEKLGIKKQL